MMNACCPNCKGINFSVTVTSCRQYDSHIGMTYGPGTEEKIDDTKLKPFYCNKCNEEYELRELVKIEKVKKL